MTFQQIKPLIWVLLLLGNKKIASAFYGACHQPLGMESRKIPDNYLTATSSHGYGTGPKFARLHSEEGDGAWCPKNVVQPGSQNKYLQVRLPTASIITRIGTQGRYGRGIGQEFMRNYMVNYSRDGLLWLGWSNHNHVKILQGNVDVTTVKIQSLNPRIAGAKMVRIIPVTSRPEAVCLRMEVYGCEWQSGLLSYTIPTPDHPISSFHMFSDDTYDGVKSLQLFHGGLGQLSDGIIGDEDTTKTMSRHAINATGYDYVGWTYGKKKHVTMTFRFDQVRNFTSMKVYCNTNKAIGASIFSFVRVTSTLDGRSYSLLTTHKISRSNVIGSSELRVVKILLRHAVARALRVDFKLGRGRLLLSEVEFKNVQLPPKVSASYDVLYPWTDEVAVTQKPTERPSSAQTSIILGALGGAISIFFVIVVALCYRQRTIKKTLVPPHLSYRRGAGEGEHHVTLERRPSPPNTNPAKCSMPIYHEILQATPDHPPTNNLYLEPISAKKTLPSPSISSNSAPKRRRGSPPAISSQTSHYAETNIFLQNFINQTLQGTSGNNIYSVPCVSPSPREPRRRKANSQMNLHGSSTSKRRVNDDEHTALLSDFDVNLSELPPEFPRRKLEFMEKLGQGQFGEVRLCLADQSLRKICQEDEIILPGDTNEKVLVAVKILRHEASKEAKENFFKEVKVMSGLLHPNIVRLLAVCTQDEPFAMVTEYMQHGDLKQYLQGFDDDVIPAPGKKVIRNEDLLRLAAQVAAGMDYLASLNFVHRDLAARNCLVGSNYQIRIGDFGMSRNMYQGDYFRIQGRAVLPVRWMSWESVLMGLFSSASDVWAFGVTLWEVYSLCRHQPFALLSDQQVIENLHHVFRKTEKEALLHRPKRCPASLFNVIRKCWRREAEERPNFSQLYSYLQDRLETARESPKPKRPQIKPPVKPMELPH